MVPTPSWVFDPSFDAAVLCSVMNTKLFACRMVARGGSKAAYEHARDMFDKDFSCPESMDSTTPFSYDTECTLFRHLVINGYDFRQHACEGCDLMNTAHIVAEIPEKPPFVLGVRFTLMNLKDAVSGYELGACWY